MDGWVDGGWGVGEPHGSRLSHVLIFVIRPLGRTKIRGSRGPWGVVSGREGGWLAVVAAGWLAVVGMAGGGGLLAGWLAGWLFLPGLMAGRLGGLWNGYAGLMAG